MSIPSKNDPIQDVGGLGRPRTAHVADGWGVGGYYVDAAHVPTTAIDLEGNRPRQTAHVDREALKEMLAEIRELSDPDVQRKQVPF